MTWPGGYDEGQLNWLQHTGYRTNDSVDGYEQDGKLLGESGWETPELEETTTFL